MNSLYVTGALPPVGFPIRKSPGQSLFSGSPKLIAAYHVLHRLSLPRHPPYALSSLTIKKLLINVLPCIPERQLRITNYELRIEFKTRTRITHSVFYYLQIITMQLSKNSLVEAQALLPKWWR